LSDTSPVANSNPSGIGGWLAVFVVLLFLQCLGYVIGFLMNEPIEMYFLFLWPALGIVAGVGMLKKNRVFGLRLAQLYLGISLLFGVGATLNKVSIGPATIAGSGVWLWYLLVSERVKNTFPK
jgi:hypothetical protein